MAKQMVVSIVRRVLYCWTCILIESRWGNLEINEINQNQVSLTRFQWSGSDSTQNCRSKLVTDYLSKEHSPTLTHTIFYYLMWH